MLVTKTLRKLDYETQGNNDTAVPYLFTMIRRVTNSQLVETEN